MAPGRPPASRGGLPLRGSRGGLPLRGRQGGFTFIELLLALAILAFAFTYGFLHLDGATGVSRIASAGRQVGSTIESLRDQAIHAARPLRMEIDLDHHQFRSALPPRPSEAEAESTSEEDTIFTDWESLPARVRFEGIQVGVSETLTTGTVTICFSPLGEVTPNGLLVRLVSDEISDPELQAFSVEVNGLTGEVGHRVGRAVFDLVVDGASLAD